MSAEKGSAFLLKVGDGGSPVGYTTVAGLRTTQMTVNGAMVEITSKDSGGWRDLLSGAGVRSVSVSAAGVFTGSAADRHTDRPRTRRRSRLYLPRRGRHEQLRPALADQIGPPRRHWPAGRPPRRAGQQPGEQAAQPAPARTAADQRVDPAAHRLRGNLVEDRQRGLAEILEPQFAIAHGADQRGLDPLPGLLRTRNERPVEARPHRVDIVQESGGVGTHADHQPVDFLIHRETSP
jgi:hypothetical protein